MTHQRQRVLLANPIDETASAAASLARQLRDRGAEVIYTDIHESIDEIGAAAIHEDVETVGLVSPGGKYRYSLPDLDSMLAEHGADDIDIIVHDPLALSDAPYHDTACHAFTHDAALDDIADHITYGHEWDGLDQVGDALRNVLDELGTPAETGYGEVEGRLEAEYGERLGRSLAKRIKDANERYLGDTA
jgi:methylmalonyl-CoA mutase C-terminal domain/subunit